MITETQKTIIEIECDECGASQHTVYNPDKHTEPLKEARQTFLDNLEESGWELSCFTGDFCPECNGEG